MALRARPMAKPPNGPSALVTVSTPKLLLSAWAAAFRRGSAKSGRTQGQHPRPEYQPRHSTSTRPNRRSGMVAAQQAGLRESARLHVARFEPPPVPPNPQPSEPTPYGVGFIRAADLAALDAFSSVAATQPLPRLTLAASASFVAVTQPIPHLKQPEQASTNQRVMTMLRDRALRGAMALMISAAAAGGLGFLFWSLTAHHQGAAAVGSVSAEVSSITFLASVGSLNLINVFARFLPEAGWLARRMVLVSYGSAALAGLLAAEIFLVTPLANGLVLGGGPGRIIFTVCVVLNSVFMIQDGGLVGFGRSGWVPVENILVAIARIVLLPVTATLMSPDTGALWSWALPMAAAVLIVNAFIVGPLASQQRHAPSLPPMTELTRFVAVESVTTAVSSAVSAFLPALVTLRLGSVQGGYFYVPWIIATMVSLLLSSILISMVREAVANPAKASAAIRRSIGLTAVVVIAVMAVCLVGPTLVLALLGHSFAAHGAPLLRWVGLAMPATAVSLLFWSTCLVRRRPWPVFAVNLATSAAIVGGVLLLRHGTDISRVGFIYCIVQWAIAVAVSIPTYRALRLVLRQKQQGARHPRDSRSTAR